MKKYILLISFFLLLVVGWFSLSSFREVDAHRSRPELAPKKNAITSSIAADQSTDATKTSDEENALEAVKDAAYAREIQQMESEAKRQYNTSIEFYGLVLDQHSHPVFQAEVQYMNADTADGKWTWKRTSTQQEGRFAIRGIRGRYLDIKIQHPGYYTLPESRHDFTYAGNDRGPNFKPDPVNPVVFRLRKKGEAAELIHREDHVLFNGDELERSFSLIDHSRRRDRPEYVILRRVETAERDNQGRPIRRLEMVVPEGGIQQRRDVFAFTAPADGYQPSLYFMRPTYGGQLDYFVQFNSGNYGRFTIMGSSGDYLIDSYLNPDSSPNLEYDREKQITVVPTGRMGVDLLYPAKKEEPKRP